VTHAGAVREPPRLALVVCTRDRAERLPACLAAIAAMRPALAWELVLVDNGSRDETPRLLDELAAGAPFPVTVVREERPGLARARNAGVAASRAPLLAFIDDDCYPAPDLLDRWAEVFADARIGFAAGRILLHDPDDFPVTVRTDDEPQPIPMGELVTPGALQGANMAFRRQVLDAIGGFDPALGPGTPFNCEDADAAARAAARFAGGYFPGPTVRHHHRRRARADIAAVERSYALGRGAYYAGVLLRGDIPRTRALREVTRLLRRTWNALPRWVLLLELLGAARYAAHRLLRRVGTAPARAGGRRRGP
jgi:hypothetical protein